MSNSSFSMVFFDLGDTIITTSRAWMPGVPEALA
jgi:hypothetical protein